MQLVSDNGLTVTNGAVVPVEALAQLEHGPDNDELFTNADDVTQVTAHDDGGLSADRVEKLLAVTDATPSPTAFDQEDRAVAGTDDTTPVATEDHEYSAASNEKLFKGVVEAAPVAGRNDEKSYAADDEGFFTGHDHMPPSDIIDIDAGDDKSLEEKEAEETSGAF